MVTDAQVRRLREKRMDGKTLAAAAAAAGMCERTARRWQSGPLPSASTPSRTWRTRPDPFAEIWASEIVPRLAGVHRPHPGVAGAPQFHPPQPRTHKRSMQGSAAVVATEWPGRSSRSTVIRHEAIGQPRALRGHQLIGRSGDKRMLCQLQDQFAQWIFVAHEGQPVLGLVRFGGRFRYAA